MGSEERLHEVLDGLRRQKEDLSEGRIAQLLEENPGLPGLEQALRDFTRNTRPDMPVSTPDDGPPGRPHVRVPVAPGSEFGPGARLGRYKLLEKLGEGGMGAVYLAEQTEPVQRRVAVKIIKTGTGPAEVLARFEAERQALALMDHPHIAKVLDGGATEAGQPFFVMELVKGASITEFCDQERLTVRQRLELFVPVCQAVQHAHTKGVIHRDLKPSNVLVCMQDGRPAPKVIDFGLAKALHRPLTEHTLHTADGFLLGTPEYMSPEQARLNNLDVDTRADVYSLGVILYELLTGSRPLGPGRASKEPYLLEMLRVLREVEPQKPSTKLAGSKDLPGLAAKRGADPKRLTRLVRGEPDWVVMKCLEKDRGRRYKTADGLAEDIQRHLAGDAVQAGPPSTWYAVRKSLRRHRVGVGFVALAVVALVALLALRAWSLARERNLTESHNVSLAQERDRTRAERDEAVRQEEIAREMAVEAKESLRLAQGVMAQLAIAMQSPLAHGYVQAASRQEEQAAGGPAGGMPALRTERARTSGRLAELTAESGSTREAVRQFEEVRDTLESLIRKQPEAASQRALATTHNNLGILYRDAGRPDLAERAYRRAKEIREQILQADPHDVDSREALAGTEGNLAILYEHTGRLKDALAAYRRTMGAFEALVAARPESAEARKGLATTCGNLGILLHHLGQPEEAVKTCEKGLGIRRELARKYPREARYRQHVAVSLGNLGNLYLDVGRLQAAEGAYREAVGLQRKLLEEHPFVAVYAYELAQSLNNLGTFYADVGRAEKAEVPLREAVRLRERLAGDNPTVDKYRYDLAGAYNNLGLLYSSAGKNKEAEELYEKALGFAERLTKERPEVRTYAQLLAQVETNRANLFAKTGRREKAAPCYQKALDLRKKLADGYPNVPECQAELAKSYNNLGTFHDAGGAAGEAEEAYRAAARIRAQLVKAYPNVPEYRRLLASSSNNLGVFHYTAGRLDKAEAAYEEALRLRGELSREAPGVRTYQHDLAESHNNLALVYSRTRRPEEAEKSFQEAIRIGEKLGQAGATVADRAALAWGHGNLGVLYSQAKRRQEAAASYRRAIDILQELSREQPDVPRFAVSLGLHTVNLARLLHAHAGPEPALSWYGKAIDVLGPLLRKGVGEATVRLELRKAYSGRANALIELKRYKESLPDWDRAIELERGRFAFALRLDRATTWARVGEHVRAAAEADDLAAQVKVGGPLLLYGAATVYAVASSAVREDPSLARADRDKAAERYAARAAELLGQAQSAGFFESPAAVDRLKTDERLAPLRTRPDFQSLMKMVGRKSAP